MQRASDLPALSPLRRLGGRLRFTLRWLGVEQALRLLACAAAILWSRIAGPRGGEDPEVRDARRLAATLGALKGPFAKVGQFASLRMDVVAPGVREGLATLRDRVPPLPFGWVREVLEGELRAPLEARFATFDPEPIGTASIGQVHRARLPDGAEVAVKVQFPWLGRSLPADLFLLRLCLRLVARGRDDAARRERLFEEFAAGVREELDFRREAEVATQIARNLASDPRIVVPRVVPGWSTSRVLTMEYFATLPLSDPCGLRNRGIAPAEVLEIVARAYAQQVFVDGLFHADPHPGNLFVLDEPPGPQRPRVLFVDFGLSKQLDPELRDEMRKGIFALLQGDLESFLAGMQRLDMIAPGHEGGVREAVETMFARLRSEAGGPLGMGGDRLLALKNEAKRLLEETEGLQLPNELLLYAKTLSYLFSLGRELSPEVDLMRLSVPYLLRFLGAPSAGRVEGEVATSPGAAGAGPEAG